MKTKKSIGMYKYLTSGNKKKIRWEKLCEIEELRTTGAGKTAVNMLLGALWTHPSLN